MKKQYFFITIIMAALLFFAGCKSKQAQADPGNFAEAMKSARGKTVTFYGWGGDQMVNRWIDTVLAQSLKEKYGVTLVRVPMNIDEILSKLMGEKQAGARAGDIDVVWINGENFYTAKNAGLLYGPITGKLENYDRYIGSGDPDAMFDFGMEIDGMEVPYGKAQLVFIADSAVLSGFPSDTGKLMELARQNRGKITYPAPPDFVGSAFVRNIIYDVAGYQALYNAPADERGLYEAIKPALDYLVELKPYLWQQGETYPKENAALDKMYVDGQALMTMNYTPLYAAQKIAAGQFPPTSQTFVFDSGNIGNTHYVAIPFNAPNKDAALVLINHIISAEMQISKYDVRNWGDLPVFDSSRLSDAEKRALDGIDNGIGILSPSELQKKRVPEIQAEKVAIIEKLWYDFVLK
ncbi:MAG: ABC transporter substrate-binding protein [Treponema sp.]|jgi:putative spermidine/putrescine transport system substrate-binding protein|nr:ABC transporter substrate-binding protein [Treponema sp.]